MFAEGGGFEIKWDVSINIPLFFDSCFDNVENHMKTSHSKMGFTSGFLNIVLTWVNPFTYLYFLLLEYGLIQIAKIFLRTSILRNHPLCS
jgi:hypothetical protein